MARLLKFLHTTSAIGLSGGLAAYMLVLYTAPDIASLAEYAALRTSLAAVSKWLLLPSMVLALVSGLLALAANTAYLGAPWAWIKALSGILIFEATLGSIDAPAQRAARAAARAIDGQIDAGGLARLADNEWGALWAILSLTLANVALGIWRPRNLGWRRQPASAVKKR